MRYNPYLFLKLSFFVGLYFKGVVLSRVPKRDPDSENYP